MTKYSVRLVRVGTEFEKFRDGENQVQEFRSVKELVSFILTIDKTCWHEIEIYEIKEDKLLTRSF